MLDWLSNHSVFLFDFDGLLVNTEEVHFESYRQMAAGRGYELPWDFTRFTHVAHYSGPALSNQVYADLPDLYQEEPDWEVLYAEKKRIYLDLIARRSVALMPGVDRLLNWLVKEKKKWCVVTNSPREQIDLIRAKIPLLQHVPLWLTREDYERPKPDPECYLKALSLLAAEGEQAVGFEDTPRGLRALLGTGATPILVNPIAHPALAEFPKERFVHIPTLEVLAGR